MGKLIILSDVRSDDQWLIPHSFINYDKRTNIFPNSLFPYQYGIYYDRISDKNFESLQHLRIAIRRCCEQTLKGDVIIDMKFDFSNYESIMELWFQLIEDQKVFASYFTDDFLYEGFLN